jgi:transposase
VEQVPGKQDKKNKALACYGLLLRGCPEMAGEWKEEIWLRFVDGCPVSGITTQFLEWCCGKLAAQGKKVLVLFWDNASWHLSKVVMEWIQAYNRKWKETRQGVHICVYYLPVKSPWLNPIEARWSHGKRKIVEPNRILSPSELEERVHKALRCQPETHLAISENVP